MYLLDLSKGITPTLLFAAFSTVDKNAPAALAAAFGKVNTAVPFLHQVITGLRRDPFLPRLPQLKKPFRLTGRRMQELFSRPQDALVQKLQSL